MKKYNVEITGENKGQSPVCWLLIEDVSLWFATRRFKKIVRGNPEAVVRIRLTTVKK